MNIKAFLKSGMLFGAAALVLPTTNVFQTI